MDTTRAFSGNEERREQRKEILQEEPVEVEDNPVLNTDYDKIRDFFRGCNEREIEYTKLVLAFVEDARRLITQFKLTPMEFCHYMNLDYEEYEAYLGGWFSYDIESMACLNAAFLKEKAKLAAEEYKKNFVGINTD